MYVSSNAIQLLQHNTGRKHINNEEMYVRDVARKVNTAGAGSAASIADDVLSQVAKLKENAERKAKGEEVIADTLDDMQPVAAGMGVKCEVVVDKMRKSEAKTQVHDGDNDGYPAPAHEVYGDWVEVKTEEVAVKDEAAGTQPKVEEKQETQEEETLRIGAEDAEDEEEAALRGGDNATTQGRRVNTKTWDTLDAAFRRGRRSVGGKKQRRRQR